MSFSKNGVLFMHIFEVQTSHLNQWIKKFESQIIGLWSQDHFSALLEGYTGFAWNCKNTFSLIGRFNPLVHRLLFGPAIAGQHSQHGLF